MRNVWFTSDTHFGHKNIVGPAVSKWPNGYRNFESIAEMDQKIIDGINSRVDLDDVLYHLGDFCFDSQKRKMYRQRIRCKNIHLIIGNHDKRLDRDLHLFSSALSVLMLKDVEPRIFLSHYSHRVWEGSHKGLIHLYGHSHGSIPDHGRSMDVGVDSIYARTGFWVPIHLTEVQKIMAERRIEYVDHHEERE